MLTGKQRQIVLASARAERFGCHLSDLRRSMRTTDTTGSEGELTLLLKLRRRLGSYSLVKAWPEPVLAIRFVSVIVSDSHIEAMACTGEKKWIFVQTCDIRQSLSHGKRISTFQTETYLD